MKRVLFLSLFLSTFLVLNGQGIIFTDGSWASVCKMAAEQRKPVFVDVYTSWCGPCKLLATKVFTHADVGSYFNEHFINYKIDAEKGEGVDVARNYRVTSYPTCLFLSPEGELISSFQGTKTVEQLLKEGEKATNNYTLLPRLKALEKEYAGGRRDKEFLQTYCSVRYDFGDKGGAPVNELVTSLTDVELTARENAKWIQTVDVYDSLLFKRLIDLLQVYRPEKKRDFQSLNRSIMKALSACLNQALEENRREVFEQLMNCKRRMVAIDESNDDNAVSASMGGGMAYVASEQVRLLFYQKNHCDAEFVRLFRTYITDKMKALPTDSLIEKSNQDERSFRELMQSDTIAADDKEEMARGREMMKLFSGAKLQVLASALFNAINHYRQLSPVGRQQLPECVSWFRFVYALNRSADVALAVADELRQMGASEEAKTLLEDCAAFLLLKGDSDEELEKVKAAIVGGARPVLPS